MNTKETAMRAEEAPRLEWVDVDPERRTIRVTPEKGSNDINETLPKESLIAK